ncbi:MAG: DUF2269 family protein [Gammaproteobacteria bacterium]|nr:DUF2269 family protein [Gammaproteobacteria bacterium]NNM00350.1 DUF2269 family protein [Gammaproteobacteria bacterium]
MRPLLKFLHSLGAVGLIGTLAAYMVLLWTAPPPASVEEYTVLRGAIASLSSWLLLPSLGVVLVTGLFAMAAHRPFLDARWAWVKAYMGLPMFEGTLGHIEAQAQRASRILENTPPGEIDPAVLQELMHSEWIALWFVMALAVGNVALAVWRPRLRKRPD